MNSRCLNPLLCATLVLSLLQAGCSSPEVTPEPASEPPQVTISDEEIDRYIGWWRKHSALGRKHLDELNELQVRLYSRYSLADLDKVQQDPELLAMVKRQRQELLDHQANKPIPREKAEGFDSVLSGLGHTVVRGGRTEYEVHHDQPALRGARAKYGDAFVDKVLSRGKDIAAAMNR